MGTTLDPAIVLFGNTRQAILSLLLMRPDESFYLREIVRRTACGVGAAQRELAQLTACGILLRQRERFYVANTRSPIFEPLKQIIMRTAGLAAGLRAGLDPVAGQIASAFIFGSFARGEQHRDSDVDVMVVTRGGRLTLERVAAIFRAQQDVIGREINPFVIPLRELRAKLLAGNHFIRRVLEGNKAFLIGDADELERMAQERLAQGARDNRPGNRRPARAGRPRSEGLPARPGSE